MIKPPNENINDKRYLSFDLVKVIIAIPHTNKFIVLRNQDANAASVAIYVLYLFSFLISNLVSSHCTSRYFHKFIPIQSRLMLFFATCPVFF